MIQRHRFVIVAAMLVVLLATRTLTPPPPVHIGAMGKGPVVVLVHGLGSSPAHWLPVARRLSTHHRVALVSLPGHADQPMSEPLSLDLAALGLEAALAREVGDEPVILVGHSIGGAVATAMALRHPSRVRGLVLVETALQPQILGAQRRQLEVALARDLAGTLREVWLGFGRDSLQGVTLWHDAMELDPDAMRAWVRLALNADLSQAVAELKPPMLAVFAERSWARGEPWPIVARALGYEHVRQLEVERIGGAGHFVMLDEPVALAERIARFAASPAGTPLAAR